jgi:hypothetical protein
MSTSKINANPERKEATMSKPETTTAEILVHLVRSGVETRDYHLPEGATLADLLRASGVSMTDRTILVDGIRIEETLSLNDGAVITIASHPTNGVGEEPWRAVSTAFQDDALFEEYMAILKAQRREEIPEEEAGE